MASLLNKKNLLVLVLFSAAIIEADVKLSSIFSDNMILQQKIKNPVWGVASPGEKVTVKASWGAEASAVADKDGRWKVFLETPKYGTGNSLTISGQNTVNIKNVAIGEVWLCAGQSNMGWSLGSSFGGEEEASSANDPEYRIFKSAREHWHNPREFPTDRMAKWKKCTPESAAATSVVSYYFGKKLRKELKIPIGIIVQAYAGTPIEGWMPIDIQKDDPRTIALMDDYKENTKRLKEKGITDEKKAMAKYEKELVAYNKKMDAGETMKNKNRELKPPSIKKPSILGSQYPSNIFNAMIYPVRPYGIKGMIWYQGERNSKTAPQAFHYRQQLPQLINYYQKSWNKLSGGNVSADFPFYFVQLPSWNPIQKKPVEGIEATWPVTREMMRLVSNNVPNTGMAVSIDVGDPVVLHPMNKKPIGIRLAYLALKQTYGKNFIDYGPKYKSMKIDGDKIILKFDSIGKGMIFDKPGKQTAFAIAGSDKKWHWADAEIDGNTVIVSSKEVSTPVAVRYAWAMNPSQMSLLYNKVGIPASPFRTDEWALFDPKAEEVRVNKPEHGRKYEAKDWKRPKMTQ